MPCTPIAVSAWRTSSSLKGFITATTSFMERLSWRVQSCLCQIYRQCAQKISEICYGGEGYPQICARGTKLPRLVLPLPQRAFLRHRGHQGAVGLEDHASREAAAGAGRGGILGV